MIDYLLLSPGSGMRDREAIKYATVAGAVDGLSDHYPLYAVLTFPSEHVRRKRLHRPLGKTKWRAHNESLMREQIAQDISERGQMDLDSLREIMERHAAQSGFVPTSNRQRLKHHPIKNIIMDLERRRSSCTCPDFRRYLSKEIWKRRKALQKWRKEEAARKVLEAGRYTQFTKIHSPDLASRVELRRQDGTIAGTYGFCEIVTDHFAKIMKCDEDSSNLKMDLRDIVFSEYLDAPAIAPDEVEHALGEMRRDKACLDAGISMNQLIIARKEISGVLAEEFTRFVQNRQGYDSKEGHELHNTFFNQEDMSDGGWYCLHAHLLEKKNIVQHPKDFRPISVLPCYFKILDKILAHRLDEYLEKIDEEDFGGRKGHQAPEIMQVLHQLSLHCDENDHPTMGNWEGKLFIGKFDVVKAFDSVSHSVLLETLLYHGVPRYLAAILVRQHRRGVMTYGNGRVRTFALKRTSGLHQGAATSMLLWRLIMARVIDIARGVWSQREDVGYEIYPTGGKKRIETLRWADDVFLIARTASALQHMLHIFSSALEFLGLRLAPDDPTKASWITNKQGKKGEISLHGTQVHQRDSKEGVSVLGHLLVLGEGHTMAAVNARVAQAWKAFAIHKKLLTSRWISKGKRIMMLNSLIRTTLFWGCEVWVWSPAVASRIRALQRAMYTKMFRIYKRDNETWDDYQSRRTYMIEELHLTKHGHCWVMQGLIQFHRWAGHIARMPHKRLAFAASQINWKFMRDISRIIIRGIKKGRVGNSRVRQGRPKARWVDQLECGGTEWHARAQDREAWLEEEKRWAVNAWIKLRGWPSLKRHVDFWEVNMAAGGGIPLGFLDRVRDIFGNEEGSTKRKRDMSERDRDVTSQSFSLGAPLPENVRQSFDMNHLGPDTDDFPLSWLRKIDVDEASTPKQRKRNRVG